MKYCILASGSKGNSIYVESQDARFLIDVGLSAKQIEQRLQTRSIDPASIDAIVLTHAHSDHVRGVSVFAKRYQIPVYGHPDTLASITRFLKPAQPVEPRVEPFQIKNIHFTPFRVSHDCDPTVGYLIENDGKVFSICTDLGVITDDVLRHVEKANALLLESNHDPEMLMGGPYPWDLKERIAGRQGHLSNHNAGEVLYEIFGNQLDHVVLGHLSDKNNHPELALKTVQKYVGRQHAGRVTVIEQKTVSEMFSL